jgi:hypothetical protein
MHTRANATRVPARPSATLADRRAGPRGDRSVGPTAMPAVAPAAASATVPTAVQAVVLALALWLAPAGGALATDGACTARSGATALPVVELYTSEGCSSCPPADRWLSTLKGRDDLLALAFHVDYWDRLGWADRFASAEATQRQYRLARALGASNVYTPQVVVQGRDWRRWPALPPRPGAAVVRLALARDGSTVTATVSATAAAAGRPLAGFWAVIEDGHASRVTAGENRGETLRHDHVVRLVRPVAAWTGDAERRFTLDVLPGDPAHPRRVAFVVEDPATLRPLQALALAC